MDFDPRIALYYWHEQTVGGTTLDTADQWHIKTARDPATGVLVTRIDRWAVPGQTQPSRDVLEALWPSAELWWPDWLAAQAARLETWPVEVRAVARAVDKIMRRHHRELAELDMALGRPPLPPLPPLPELVKAEIQGG